jgi:hypothetical protein
MRLPVSSDLFVSLAALSIPAKSAFQRPRQDLVVRRCSALKKSLLFIIHRDEHDLPSRPVVRFYNKRARAV